MEKEFLDYLKTMKIINKDDIERMKLYIDKNYASSSSKEKAELLSTNIHYTLDSYINGINDEQGKKIKKEILNSFVKQNEHSIFMYDIFQSLINTKEDNKKKQVANIHKWLNRYTKTNITQEELYNTVYPEKKLLSDIPIEIPIEKKEEKMVNNFFFKKRFVYICSAFIILGVLLKFIPFYNESYAQVEKNTIKKSILKLDKQYVETGVKLKGSKLNANIPEYMKYKEVDQKKLELFLRNKKSIIADEPYLSTIICSAKEFDLNPIVLFSIVGQEQGFIPTQSINAEKIANNPFNVYHSWEEYNTDIYDSSQIAARTVFNLSKDMPKGENPFRWINKKYAEDKNWWKGVDFYFKEITKFTDS